jgi:hypothetical protein
MPARWSLSGAPNHQYGCDDNALLALSTLVDVETCEHPDSQKILVVTRQRGERGLRKMFRAETQSTTMTARKPETQRQWRLNRRLTRGGVPPRIRGLLMAMGRLLTRTRGCTQCDRESDVVTLALERLSTRRLAASRVPRAPASGTSSASSAASASGQYGKAEAEGWCGRSRRRASWLRRWGCWRRMADTAKPSEPPEGGLCDLGRPLPDRRAEIGGGVSGLATLPFVQCRPA